MGLLDFLKSKPHDEDTAPVRPAPGPRLERRLVEQRAADIEDRLAALEETVEVQGREAIERVDDLSHRLDAIEETVLVQSRQEPRKE